VFKHEQMLHFQLCHPAATLCCNNLKDQKKNL
jgi:hypothetical protein